MGRGVEGPLYQHTVLCEEWCSALGGREWGFRGCCSVRSVRAGAVSVGTCSEEGIANICSVPHLLLSYVLSLVNSTDHVDSIPLGRSTFY